MFVLCSFVRCNLRWRLGLLTNASRKPLGLALSTALTLSHRYGLEVMPAEDKIPTDTSRPLSA